LHLQTINIKILKKFWIKKQINENWPKKLIKLIIYLVLNWSVKIFWANSKLHSIFVPFLSSFSFSRIFGPCYTFLQIKLNNLNGQMKFLQILSFVIPYWHVLENTWIKQIFHKLSFKPKISQLTTTLMPLSLHSNLSLYF